MSSHNPRLSIGIPVHNGGRFIKETLDAFLKQSYSQFELIVADNASDDETQEVCLAYSRKYKRIRYYRSEKNYGAAWNHNRIVKLSSCEFFMWGAADDLCESDYVERCIQVLDNDPTIVLACAKTRFIDEDGQSLDIYDPGWNLRAESAAERFHTVINSRHWVNALFGVLRADALSKTRLLAAYPGGDYRLLGELSLLGKFFEIPEYLWIRRIHRDSASQNNTDVEWTTRFYCGDGRSIYLPLGNLYLDHFRTVFASDLSFRAKLYLFRTLGQLMRWDKNQLWNELKRYGFLTWNRIR
jgi:glycosyltransferase involved in cell wall biosynthesis